MLQRHSARLIFLAQRSDYDEEKGQRSNVNHYQLI